MQTIISLDTEKLARRGFQHDGPAPPPTGEALGGGLSDPDAYELIKTPSHRLVRSQYCGIVWVKEKGSWRDLEICASPKVCGGGGRRPPSAPLPGKCGGEHPLAPLVPTPMPEIERRLSRGVKNVMRWCNQNDTALSVPKSSSMVVSTRQKLARNKESIRLKVDYRKGDWSICVPIINKNTRCPL